LSEDTENARKENAAQSKVVEYAGLQIAVTKMQGWKMWDQAGMESQPTHYLMYTPIIIRVSLKIFKSQVISRNTDANFFYSTKS